MAITTFVRKEKKYLITEAQRQTLLKLIEPYMNYDSYCLNGNKYIVNNVYFDTPTFNVIRNSLASPKYKEKLRTRSYIVESKDDDIVFLEVKKKVAGVVNKRRIVMCLKDVEHYLLTNERPNEITAQQKQIFNEIDYSIKDLNLKPAVYLSYIRLALFAKDNPEIRLTIDEDIITRTSDITLRSSRYGDKLLPQGYYLMEIKVSGAFPLWLAHILTDLKIYPTSFSKYGKFYQGVIKERISHDA